MGRVFSILPWNPLASLLQHLLYTRTGLTSLQEAFMQTSVSVGQEMSENTGFRVEPLLEGGHRLHVRGKLPIDWVGNLASGLAQNGHSITHGKVFREGVGWHGHIALQSKRISIPPERLDYHRMVNSGSNRMTGLVSIDSYVMRPTEEKGGTLLLEIEGKDQHGFLGAFLSRLSFYSLFPVHIEIETIGGMIHDRFWLKGIGGVRPTEVVVAALRGTLGKMVIQ
jgi:hypothetical protein